jgi:hypothetical protein
MRRFLTFLVGLGLLLGLPQQARAQSTVQLNDVGVTYMFGEQITFSAKIQAQTAIQEVFLFFQAEGDQNTRTVPLTIGADGSANYTYLIQNGLLRPFSHLIFWYHLTLANNETYDSPRYYFQYDDNRYPWQSLESSNIRVHWYSGDISFGQAALNAAISGYQSIQTMIPITGNDPINIYVYMAADDVQNTLSLGGYTWIGGHASPDLGVVLVSIAPGETQSIEMERQIPHELAHVLLYRLTGANYAHLPTWLLEGIASQAEQYPNADYEQMLSVAKQKKTLIRISDLCGPFPMDASGAILAYAESDSFTRYLNSHFGTSSMRALIQAYSDGLGCDQGPSRALGVSLTQLDSDWRTETFGSIVSASAVQNFLPYIILFVIMLIIPAWQLGLSMQKKETDEDHNTPG